MANHFNRVGGLKPRRNAFDLSYRVATTCDMGELIPIQCDEAVPGDTWTMGAHLTVRLQPMVAPVYHEITAHIHTFFVPFRIMWPQWETFIASDVSNVPVALPRINSTGANVDRFTLWDYFGLETGSPTGGIGSIRNPVAWPWMAYNTVYNEYYRDQDIQTIPVNLYNGNVLRRNWRKDYFTAARPFRQKGVAPALPVNVSLQYSAPAVGYPDNWQAARFAAPGFLVGSSRYSGNVTNSDSIPTGSTDMTVNVASVNTFGAFEGQLGVNKTEIFASEVPRISANSTTFDVSDLRLAIQTQKWLERNARGGTRYTEFLRSHFGVAPSDARLHRPEYIGGIRLPINISEVLQTSETSSTALATMAGHGLGSDGQYIGKYHVQEYGVIISLLSVMPKPSYSTGINRQWLRLLPTDYYFPEFAHLSEQAIYNQEIFAGYGNLEQNMGIFGYTGQYDEMRVKHDLCTGEMRSWRPPGVQPVNPQLNYWTMSREFFGNVNLNSNFIECNPTRRIFAVTSSNYKTLIVNCRNLIKAVRPMPLIAEPGLVDHF